MQAPVLPAFADRPVRIAQPSAQQAALKAFSTQHLPPQQYILAHLPADEWRIAAYSQQPQDSRAADASQLDTPGNAGLALPVPIRIPQSAKRLRTGVISRTVSAPGEQLELGAGYCQI